MSVRSVYNSTGSGRTCCVLLKIGFIVITTMYLQKWNKSLFHKYFKSFSFHTLIKLYQQHTRQNKVDALLDDLVYLSGRLDGSFLLVNYHFPLSNSPM